MLYFPFWQVGLNGVKFLYPEVLESAGLFQIFPGLYQEVEWMTTELSKLLTLSPWI